MLAAHRAIGIFAQLQLAELHGQGVEKKQASGETVAAAENQLDCLHGLNGANNSGGHAEDGHLAFKAENRTVDVGLAQENASIVHQVAGRKIIGAIDDDIEVLE